MSVKLRMQRHGSRHRPFYHIVATDSRAPRNGKFIEKLGYYDPALEPSVFEIKTERIQYWYSKGARPSQTVANLLKKTNVKLERDKPAKK